MKKTILIDLDGVLNTYTGDFNKNFIPPIKEGAAEFLKELSEEFIIKIFTTRNKILASRWIVQNNISDYIDDITNVNELSYLYVDDRCIKFNGDFVNLIDEIRQFKVWYK